MSDITATQHGVIVNDDHQFGIWPTDRRLPSGWRYTGQSGTLSEMQALLRMQFVETVAAPLITSGRAPWATQWALGP